MKLKLSDRIITKLSQWIGREKKQLHSYLCDFDRLVFEIRPCDVLLVESNSLVSRWIKKVIQSPWAHAALYIGRYHDIEDLELRELIQKHLHGEMPKDRRLIIESEIGKGTYVTALDKYRNFHVRICRAQGISQEDAKKVINYGIHHLGRQYSVRHILDLARLLLPWRFIPKRMFSSLFRHPTKVSREICSSLIAEAFTAVDYPILPYFAYEEEKGEKIETVHRNPRLFTPADFDYSPYFTIIKYPLYPYKKPPYRRWPWKKEAYSHDEYGVSPLQKKLKEEQKAKKKLSQDDEKE